MLVGHVATSPVVVSDGTPGWHGLGPISVLPECQRQGIGSALMRHAIAEAARLGHGAIVLVGTLLCVRHPAAALPHGG